MQAISVLNSSSRESSIEWLESHVKEWSQLWFHEEPALSFKFNEALFSSERLGESDTMYRLNNANVVIFDSSNTLRSLSRMALKISQVEDFVKANKVLKEIEQRQVSTLFQTLFGAQTESQVCHEVSFQRAITVEVIYDSATLTLGLDLAFISQIKQFVRSQNKHTRKMVSRSQASGVTKLAISASLDSIKIPLRDLLNLKVGDVVQLTHKLDQPINLDTNDKEIDAHAYLVKSGTRKALVMDKQTP